MDYDKYAIKKAQDDNLFDDSFDPLSLSLSRNEKENIVGDLNKAREEMTGRQAQQGKSAKKGAVKTKKPHKSGLSLTQRIVRFFLMLFTGMSKDEYLRQRKLKKIQKELRNKKPAVYNFKNQMISASLARQVFNLFEYLMPYKTAFDRVFQSDQQDESKLLDFQIMFMRVASRNEKLKELSHYSEESEALQNAVNNHKEQELRDKIQQELRGLFESFSEEERKRVDASYNEILNISDLLNFDFIAFLEKFNRDFNVSQNNKPAFRDAHPMGLTRLIKELNNIILQINPAFIPQAFETARHFYKESIIPDPNAPAEHKEAFENLMERMAKNQYRPLIAAITSIIKDNRLTLLIRFVSKEFKYQPQLTPRKHQFFSEFQKNLNRYIDLVLSKLYKQKTRDSVNKKLFALLNLQEMPDSYVYSVEQNPVLDKLGVLTFAWPKLLNFAMIYFQEKYFAYHKKVLNKILVDAHFEDNELMRAISEQFYDMDELFNQFIEYTTHVSKDHERGQLLETMITKFRGDNPSRNALNSRIGSLNSELEKLLQSLNQGLHRFNELLAQEGTVKALGQSGEKAQNLHKHHKKLCEELQLSLDIMANLKKEQQTS